MPEAVGWATTYATLVLARCLASGVSLEPGTPAATHARAVLGERLVQSRSLRDLTGRLPRRSAWLLADVSGPEDLWAAEASWWHRLWGDGLLLVRRGGAEPGTTVGAVAALAADAWRVRGALEVAAREGKARRWSMTWPDALAPTRMERIAVVSPLSRVRSVLVAVAAEGAVEPERLDNTLPGPAGSALQRIQRGTRDRPLSPVLGSEPVDVASLVGCGDLDRLAGEAELEQVRSSMVDEGAVTALAGWSPAGTVDDLAARLAPLGASVVRLRRPPGVQPPTALKGGGRDGGVQPLVNTYGTVPYADVNPSVLAGLAYVVMFGMMFGDVGQGLLLLGLGIAVWRARPGKVVWLSRFHWAAPFVIGAALASIAFGFAYASRHFAVPAKVCHPQMYSRSCARVRPTYSRRRYSCIWRSRQASFSVT